MVCLSSTTLEREWVSGFDIIGLCTPYYVLFPYLIFRRRSRRTSRAAAQLPKWYAARLPGRQAKARQARQARKE